MNPLRINYICCRFWFMKKVFCIVLLLLSVTSAFAQKNALGANYNVGVVFGENNNKFKMSIKPLNFGLSYKSHLNQRIASRITLNHIATNIATIEELSYGVDYHLKKFNPFRSHHINLKSTPYIILEGTLLYYQSPSKSGLSSSLPIFGIGYKRSVDYHWQWSIENKTRISFTDALDGNVVNGSTLDSYNITSVSVFYTFGKLDSDERIKF